MQTINIEWRHLVENGNTCIRCNDTGTALRQVVLRMNEECLNVGCHIQFVETELGMADIAESNSILINGTPIENVLPDAQSGESHCLSCCELVGQPTDCRTVEFGGKRFEAIPESLIRQAVCQVARCC